MLIDGKAEADPTQGIAGRRVALALANKDLEAVLRLLGRGEPTWAELYVVYELVDAACAGKLDGAGWVSKKELIRFRRTANNYSALGLHARHGPSKEEPPSSPMEHGEALALMRGVVEAWLRHESQWREEMAAPVLP